ncbi:MULTISPECIES: RNA polymerase sigma factor [Sphingobacterium]|uniref:RNA polymerase sigma factor n=1 Tax=Sphingobacterium TaxID=28453 RepID=UPI0016134BA7|nr:sigma-70 family RNA polymerase sigma factor [Sphingobacterium sp. JUb56]MBB2951683.1 RNA polymerase sigma-70 factor (ECF subfamily) [Sphingobacterium sp. JUb56]
MYTENLYSLEELYLLVKRSDVDAYNVLYERTWKGLYQHAFSRLNDELISKEIVQDVYIDLWVKRHEKEIQQVSNYLYTAIRYKIIDQFRKSTKKLESLETIVEYMASVDQADHNFREEELQVYLNYWIDKLPKKRREIFKLKYFDDLNNKEIGEILNVSPKTVQNQLLTASKWLKNQLKEILFLFF